MAYSAIRPDELAAWCSVPAEALSGHPEAKLRLRVLPSREAVADDMAQEIFTEIQINNGAGRPTRLILPCGPTDQYPVLVGLINAARLTLRDVHVFHMDDFLDWQGRLLPVDDPRSYQGWMRRNFYDRIDPDLTVPEPQRHFPVPTNVDTIQEAIDVIGGIDTTYGGIGYHGHIAYNEPPLSPWYVVPPEEFRASRARVLHLNDDTLIALSQRMFGGCSQMVPPMAVTLGMRDLLNARRIRLYSTTGAWKQTVIRIAVFGPVTPEYPVTLCQEHPDAVITVDQATAEAPL